jgi:hypothetical protein
VLLGETDQEAAHKRPFPTLTTLTTNVMQQHPDPFKRRFCDMKDQFAYSMTPARRLVLPRVQMVAGNIVD